MNKPRNKLIAIASLVMLVITLALINSRYTVTRGAADPPVTVVNTTAQPVPVRDVDNPARQPFQTSTSSPTNAFNAQGFGLTLITVPAGKRLVIEFVSATCSPTGAGGVVPNPLRVTTQVDHWFALQPGNQIGLAVGTHLTSLYADPGTKVNLTVFPTSNAATVICNVAVSGYFIAP